MSSIECDLRNERPERPGEFTFTWSVQNYSYCTLEAGQFLFSPVFVVDFLGETKLLLKIYPRGDGTPGFLGSYLYGRRKAATCNFTLAIRMSNGQFKESGENVYDFSDVWNDYSSIVSLEELKGSAGYLDNDTLTVRCRMWKNGADTPASVKWEAHSRIKVSKLDYTWIVNDIPCTNGVLEKEFIKFVDITEFFTDDTKTILHLFKKESVGEYSLMFGIEMIKPKKKYFWKAVVHIMDADGKVSHSASGEYMFPRSDENLLLGFPLISIGKICTNRKLYLTNNQLTLQCKLSFATDNKLENFVFRKKNVQEIESISINKQSDLQRVWNKKIQQKYKEGKFSDFIIRTHSRQFPVHRFILSAHSEVFDAMFESDMKEGKTGIVDIKDLDDETVSKMLKYVYASTLDVSDCPSAQNLYFAADKYGMADLKEQCSSYLMSSLDASNVCDIILLADRHEDKDLKSYASNFFHAHSQEVMASESWKKLKENNSALAFEIMEWLFCNKNVM